MDQSTRDALLAAVRRCGLYPDAVAAAAEQALDGAGASDEAAAESLRGLGVLTDFQYRKVRAGRAHEFLFGPFLVLAKVGEGGMGKVYHAVQTDTFAGVPAGRELALKIVRGHLVANRTVMRRYEREAAAAAALDHPNIVKLFAAADFHGRYFLAMEYVNGIDLARLVKEFGDPPRTGLAHYQEACEYVRQAALGLVHAHSRGLIHRDIKPANLLVAGDRALPGTAGNVILKILDMGLVRSTLDDDPPGGDDLTRDGTVVGTPDYMSPEQAKNSSTVDPRADLYSLGCAFYYLLKGQPPFPDGTAIDKLLRHQLDPVPDIRRGRPDIPAGVADIVTRLLQKRPSDRYQTAAEVAAVLAPFSGSGSATAPAYEPFSFTDDPDAVYTGPPLNPPPVAEAAAPVAAPPNGSTPSVKLKVKVRAPAALPSSSALPAPAGRAEVPPAAPKPATPKSGAAGRPRSPVAIPKPAEAPSSDSLPGTGRTPVRPLPRTRRRQSDGESAVPVLVWWAAGAVAIVGLVVVFALALSGRNRPAPKPDAPTGEAPAPAPPAGPVQFAAVRTRIPAGATAVAVLHPEDYARRTESQRPGPRLAANLARLAGKRQFDALHARRVVVTWTAAPEPAVAVGEGGPLAPAFLAELDARPNPQGALAGVRAAAFPTGPRIGAVLDGHAYALANDPRPIAALADGELSPGWDPHLPTDAPLLAFAAGQDYRLPTGRSLGTLGVTKLTATVRLTDAGVDVQFVFAGRSGGGPLVLGPLTYAVDLLEQFPDARPFVEALVNGQSTVDRGAESETTLRASFGWDAAHAALDALLPAGDGE